MTEMAWLVGAMPQVPDTPERGPDWSLNETALPNSTAEECTPMQAVKQPVTLDSIDHWVSCQTNYDYVCSI